MLSQCETIIEAFQNLGGVRSIKEISDWVTKKYGDLWKDFGTQMADMVPRTHEGNNSSSIPAENRVLQRLSRGKYSLIHTDDIKIKPKL